MAMPMPTMSMNTAISTNQTLPRCGVETEEAVPVIGLVKNYTSGGSSSASGGKSCSSSPSYGSSSAASTSDGLGTLKLEGGTASRKPAAFNSSMPGRSPIASNP